MNHAKKMILIDQQTLDRISKAKVPTGLQVNKSHNALSATNAIRDKITALRNEMKQILRLKDLDDNEKLSRYQETLRRYLHFISISPKINNLQTNEPAQPECREKTVSTLNEVKQEIIDNEQELKPSNTPIDPRNDENYTGEDGKNSLKDELLRSISEKKRNTAEEIFTILTNSEIIDWDDIGTVRIKGRDIVDSSIIELISDILTNRQTSSPIGWQKFSEVLKELKVPMKYITNTRRKNFIRSQQNGAASSPIKSAEKSKKRKIDDLSPVSRAVKRRSARVLTTAGNWKRFNFAS